MKSRLAGWVVAGVLGLSAQAGEVAGGPERQILALTREWVEAETNRDEAALRRILDDRIVATVGTGQPFGKEDYIKGVMEVAARKMVGHDLREQTVVVEGDTGVEVGTDAIRFVTKGAETISTYRYTATYIKRGDRWTVLALHMVKLPPDKG